MNTRKRSRILQAALAVLVLAGCVSPEIPATSTQQSPSSPAALPSRTPGPTQTQETVVEPPRSMFASYNLEPVPGRPSLEQEPIDPQMGNVLVPLVLSAEQLQQLAEAGVVASPARYPEFHVLYKETVRNNLPVFVTSDALLHVYHLTFDQMLSTLEEEVFISRLRDLNGALLEQARVQNEQLQGTVSSPILRSFKTLHSIR